MSSFFVLLISVIMLLASPVSFGADGSESEKSPHVANVQVSQGLESAPFDLQFSFDASAASGAGGNAGAEFDGTYYYSTRWASTLIHKYDAAGQLVEPFTIPGVTSLRDLAFDGVYMYGSNATTTIYQMDFTTKTLVGTISSPIVVRHIAYDPVADGFWVGTWDTEIMLVSRTGATLDVIEAEDLLGKYGSAYDGWTPGGPYLWVFDQGEGADSPQLVHQFEISSGLPTGVTYDVGADFVSTGDIAGGLFSAEGIVPGTASLGGLLQGTPNFFFVYELATVVPLDPLAPYGVTFGSTGSANTTNPGALLTIDPVTGDATIVGPTGIVGDAGPSVPAIAIKSTGEIYGVSAAANSGLYTINASTGAGTFVANTGVSLPNAMAFDGYDQLYITDGNSNLYTLDEATGSSALVGPLGFNVRGIAFDPTDGTMFGSSGTDGIYTIDPTTAVATFIGNTGLGGSTPDIHFDLDGNFFGTKIGGGTIYNYISINKQTGAGTVIGSTGLTAVIGLSARQLRSDIVPVSMDIEIDPMYQTVPPMGASFPYEMTFTNNTPRTQHVDYWTKLVRPSGNPFDPIDGPVDLTLAPFESVFVDTNVLAVPANAVPGDYSLIGFVGRFEEDTLDSDTTGFTKVDDSIQCEDIAQFKARCRPGGLVQAKAIFTDFTHVGETVEISVDQFPYEVTVGINGQATFSQTGFNPGVHTVELTDPSGCFPPIQVTCGAGVAFEPGEEWDERWDVPAATALVGNYPNPFNPSTTFRYTLASPGDVSLNVYNMLGQLVRTIVNEHQVEGHYEALWDGKNETGATVASGIYVYRLAAGSFVETKRMVLMK